MISEFLVVSRFSSIFVQNLHTYIHTYGLIDSDGIFERSSPLQLEEYRELLEQGGDKVGFLFLFESKNLNLLLDMSMVMLMLLISKAHPTCLIKVFSQRVRESSSEMT